MIICLIHKVLGTEFNPHLYKSSMLALQDVTEKIPCFLVSYSASTAKTLTVQTRPRVFFMDSNIKDLSSMQPCTHVYSFNIGMPSDVAQHILDSIANSTSVKYALRLTPTANALGMPSFTRTAPRQWSSLRLWVKSLPTCQCRCLVSILFVMIQTQNFISDTAYSYT
jgi:hypothetical protein